MPSAVLNPWWDLALRDQLIAQSLITNGKLDGKQGQRQDRVNGHAVDLARFDPSVKPFSKGSKDLDLAEIQQLATRLDFLQELLYANRKHSMLVVLQGMDTSGKDGTIRSVFGLTDPLGVRAIPFKAPTEAERSRGYLWRIHQQVPGSGEIVIFNRSHYEDVLVPVVEGWIDDEQRLQRYRQINEFEQMLVENGCLILKFYLHISSGEQRTRLQARVDDPSKHWKFDFNDLTVRQKWSDYAKAYEMMLGHTSTAHAPWAVVPANSKTHRNLQVAKMIVAAVEALKLGPPPAKPELKGVIVS